MSELNEVSSATSASGSPTPTPDSGRAVQLGEEEARARINTLEREAKAIGNDPAAALYFHEIGLLWEDPLRNPRHAAVAYQNAYKLAPRFVANIRAARRLFSEVGNWQMVVQLVDAELAATAEPRARAALFLEKGQVLDSRLSREDEALRAYDQCLQSETIDLAVLLQLERTATDRADAPMLARVFRLLAGAVQSQDLKAYYLAAAGFLLEEKLKQPDEAAPLFHAAFGLSRADPALLAAEERVAERTGSTDRLLGALAAEAELLGESASPIYLQIAKVYERSARPEDALAALLAARRASPKDPLVLSELSRIYESQARHDELVQVLTEWVDSIVDDNEMVAINLRLAALLEEVLRRDDDAIERYQAILRKLPGNLQALAGLGRLYFRVQNWNGLVAAFDAEVSALSEPKQKAARLYKAAEILEQKLGRIDDAVARYNQSLQLQPGYLPAQQALTRLYERQNRFAELVAMLEIDLVQISDRDQTIATLERMARIYAERLSDLERASDCYRRILELSPDHLPSLRNLGALYERMGRWSELLQLHEAESTLSGDTKQVLSLHHRNAEILEEHLNDRQGAVSAYERLLALSPSYLPALKALGRLYSQDGRWEDLVRMYRAEAEIAASTEQAAALIFKIGELTEQRLKNEDEAIGAYQEVLTLAPTYFPAVRALARIFQARGAWEPLVEILRAEAANRTDPIERANALYQSAAIWEDRLERTDMALFGYQEVLRLAPAHLAALRALERLHAGQDNLKELVAILDRQSQAGPPQTRLAALLKLARLFLDRLGDPSRAVACCEAVLAIEPDNLTALKTLERARGADPAKRAEARARLMATVDDPIFRGALAVASASELGRQGTGSPAQLLQSLSAALQTNPNDAGLALSVERLLRASGNYPALVSMFVHRLELTNEPLEKQQLLLRIADTYESRIGDPAQALGYFRAAVELNPALVPALLGVHRTALAQNDHALARSALEKAAESFTDKQAAADAWVRVGRLCLDRLQDLDGAAASFRRALEADPLNATATHALEELLANRGGAADLAALHERRAEARLMQKDLGSAATELCEAARIYLTQLKDHTQAMGAVDRALAAAPTHSLALEFKGDLALDQKDYAEAAAAYAVRVQQGGEPQQLAAIHLKLGALYHDQLSDLSRATAHLQTVLATDGGNIDACERLAGIHTATRNWTGAADCLKRLIELENRPVALARHTLNLARVYDEGFADAEQAAGLYRRALELAPADATVVDRLVEFYERTNRLPELAEVLEQRASSLTDPRRALPVRLRLGNLFLQQLNDPQRALAAFKQAAALDPTSVEAHAMLGDLYARDPSTLPLAIEEHRVLLRLDPSRVESLHALFRIWEGARQLDRAFCVAAVLVFLGAADEAESAYHATLKERLPTECPLALQPQDIEQLEHPGARNPIVPVLRSMGDQLSKLFPPQLEAYGVDRKADRLKADNPTHRSVAASARVFGVTDFEVYQARRGLVTLDTTDPLGLLVGQELVRRFAPREQQFLIGRAALGLYNKSAVLGRVSTGEATELVASMIRIHQPEFALFGRRNDDQSKALRKAASRKALKQLEGPAQAAASVAKLDIEATLAGLDFSADRAGLLLCGDPAAALNVVAREESAPARPEGEAPPQVTARRELRDLLAFSLSDDFFQLRQRAGMVVSS